MQQVKGPLAPTTPRSAAAAAASRVAKQSRASSTDHVVLLDRRQLLLGAAAAGAVLNPVPAPSAAASKPAAAGDWSSPGLAAPEDDTLPRFFKTRSGAKVQEIAGGSGPTAQPGDAVLVDFVLRRANGYFIYSTLEGVSFQPRDVPVGPVRFQLGSGELIEGLEDALVGMQQGAKRRVLVPPEAGYVSNVLLPQPPTFATKRQLANHSNEPLLFEIQLLRVLRV